jgi:hypothetical protein
MDVPIGTLERFSGPGDQVLDFAGAKIVNGADVTGGTYSLLFQLEHSDKMFAQSGTNMVSL